MSSKDVLLQSLSCNKTDEQHGSMEYIQLVFFACWQTFVLCPYNPLFGLKADLYVWVIYLDSFFSFQYTEEEVERSYEEFYEDVHTEFLKFGEIVNFKVSNCFPCLVTFSSLCELLSYIYIYISIRNKNWIRREKRNYREK